MEELGVAEIPGPKHNQRILEYFLSLKSPISFKSDEVAWCSAFVNWCLSQEYLTATNSPLARSWMTWGEATDEPKEGDIVVFFKRDSDYQGHVGFFITFNKHKNRVLVLGGNQGDMVSYRWYPVNGKNLYVRSYRTIGSGE